MRIITPLAIAIAAVTLTACGSGSSNNNTADVTKARAAVSSGTATALQVAAAKRGNVHCPATLKAAPRATGMPVDDIQGVRPGLTYDEAENLVLCSNPLLIVSPTGAGFQIREYGYKVRQGFRTRVARKRAPRTHRQIMHDLLHGDANQLKPGDEKWFVSTMGLPGKERVIAVWRDQWFATGHNPTEASVKQALIKKYGKPTRVTGSTDRPELCWGYDRSSSPIPGACGGANDDGDISLNGRTGVAVQAWIKPMDKNHALARDLIVNVLDNAGGYAALTNTEKGLKAMDAARRASQVKKAAKNAGDVHL